MRRGRWQVALWMVLCWHGETPAQFAPFVPGYGFAPGMGIQYRGRHLGVSGFLAPPLYGYGFGYPYPYGYSNVAVTYIYSPPPPVVMTPPIIINNHQTVVVGNGGVERIDDGEFLRIVPRPRKPDEGPGKLLRPEVVVPKERVKPRPAEVKPAAAPPRRAKTPREENARLDSLGKAALADRQHGLAERRFQRAIEAAPAEALTYFHLAQAQVALGKYREAVASIQNGLRRRPDWPGALFQPEDLHGDQRDDFREHLKRLEETLAQHPDDPFLLFLQAYQLWFGGKAEEARKLFLRAAEVTPDKTFIHLFLKAKPAVPVARK